MTFLLIDGAETRRVTMARETQSIGSADGELRARLGFNGRAYAKGTFDMQRITDQFETVLAGAAQPRSQLAAE